MTDYAGKSPCRHPNAKGRECVAQQYSSTKTMPKHLGPGAGENELALAEFEPARLISSGVSAG